MEKVTKMRDLYDDTSQTISPKREKAISISIMSIRRKEIPSVDIVETRVNLKEIV